VNDSLPQDESLPVKTNDVIYEQSAADLEYRLAKLKITVTSAFKAFRETETV